MEETKVEKEWVGYGLVEGEGRKWQVEKTRFGAGLK